MLHALHSVMPMLDGGEYLPAPETEAALPFRYRALEEAGRSGELRALAGALVRGGLRPEALRPMLGINCANRMEIETLESPAPETMNTLRRGLPWLLVAGAPLAAALIATTRATVALCDRLERLGFIEVQGGQILPRVSILPIGGQLILCDPPVSTHAVGGAGRDLVAAPDLSAYHLIAQIQTRGAGSWLDVATGTGVVGLVGRRARGALLGTDFNDRASAFAQASSWLNGAAGTHWRCADLFEAGERGRRWQLVTFNPPLVEIEAVERDDDLPLYVAGAPGLFERFWSEVRDRVEPDGEVVTHGALPEDPEFPWSLGLPGSFALIPFTLGGYERFCITRWHPGGGDRVVVRPIADPERPVVDA